MLLGPRRGKYVGKEIRPILGHSMPLAAIGVFLLWMGWFGFNGGSVLSANPAAVSLVCVTTTLAAAAGIISSMLISWTVQKKPDLSMVLNGCLAGLVGITASADVVTPLSSIVIGFIAGILVVFAVMFFDKLKLDDPVGALSVHLVCGVWGTLAVGLFSTAVDEKTGLPVHLFSVQLLGVVVYGGVAFVAASVILGVIKLVMGLRVSQQEEWEGLDVHEHGGHAYPYFSGAK